MTRTALILALACWTGLHSARLGRSGAGPVAPADAFGEQARSQAIALALEESLRREYRPVSVRRDAHPKAHGGVRAQFEASESLPQGMFVPGKSYDAWLRFSNGSHDATCAPSAGMKHLRESV